MKNKKFITAIVIVLFLIFTFFFLNPSLKVRTEWNKISKDYDIIAEAAFDYYKEYMNERDTQNGIMFLDISEDGELLTQTIYSPDKEDAIYYLELNEKQKAALKNLSNYYTGSKRQETIMIKSVECLEITDDDAVGAFAIIKSKEKPTNWENYKIHNLGNDWWQVVSLAR